MFEPMGLFVMRDSFWGRSPGKMAMGVQVYDEVTGEPAGFMTSVKRNLPLLIPFMPLVVATTMLKGPRLGDGWARSKVVWLRYADHPVFVSGMGQPESTVDAGPWQELPEDSPDTNPYRASRF